MRRRRALSGLTLPTLAAILAAVAIPASASAATSFTAQGSAQQVYVTGCAGEREHVAAQLRGSDRGHAERGRPGRAAVPQRLAGIGLPRPAQPLRADLGARDGPLQCRRAVGSLDLQPVDPGQRVPLPDDARRHAARDRRPSAEQPRRRAGIPLIDHAADVPAARRAEPDLHRAVPDPDRVLRLRLRQPRRPGQRHRGARQPDGLRGRRRQHAGHRLLGWRLRLLRAAPEPRRATT